MKIHPASRLCGCGLLTLAAIGCVTADRVLRHVDFATEEERVDNALWVAEVVADTDEEPLIRAYGGDALGMLRAATPEVVKALGETVVAAGPEEPRSRAAWALGELGRDLPWTSAGSGASLNQQLHKYLVDALGANLSRQTAYFVCEAIGKEYVGKEHSFDEDLATAEGLTALAADQTRVLPSLYWVVFNKIASLEVLIRLAGDNIRELSDGATQEEMEEAYAAAFNVLRRIHDDRNVLLASFEQRRQFVQHAIDTVMAGLAPNIRTLTMMLLWYAGAIGDNAPLGELVAEYVVKLCSDSDVLVRFVTSWSSARMQLHARRAREALRDEILRNESDLDVLRVLMSMHLEAGSADLIQRAYGVEVGTPEVNP